MAEPASSEDRNPFATLTLAGIGALALVAERADELADEIARRLGMERDEVRTAVAEVIESWKREARRIGEQTGETASRLSSDLGVASREALGEIELRVAQVEHRLKLLERRDEAPDAESG